jgi:hypothetical protein
MSPPKPGAWSAKRSSAGTAVPQPQLPAHPVSSDNASDAAAEQDLADQLQDVLLAVQQSPLTLKVTT